MLELIEKYVTAHENAWAESTKRSESSRLKRLASGITGDPARLWKFLERNLAPYSRVTAYTRVSDFWEWCIRKGHVQGPNRYAEWREENARLFKHVYQRKQPDLTYREARARVETLGCGEVREKCLQLLEGGLRYSESNTYDPASRTVVGKGGKRRRVYTNRQPKWGYSYSTLLRALRPLGLTPHDLRKLAATEFRKRGLNEENLCKVMGWESFETARSYLQTEKEDELEQILAEK